jgi:hypothetical protein
MPVLERLVRQFEELEAALSTIEWHPVSHGGARRYAPEDQWRGWASSAMHLLVLAFGEGSAHTENFKNAYALSAGYDTDFAQLRGIFLAASRDYRAGFGRSVEASITGEVLGDFVTASKTALAEGHKDVAAVLACAALEDALKRYARLNGLDVDDRVMQEVIAALKSKGLVGGPQRALLDAMPRVRDAAMHANWDRIQPADVSSVIGFVEQFLLTKFG